jgi:hypothetical protein
LGLGHRGVRQRGDRGQGANPRPRGGHVHRSAPDHLCAGDDVGPVVRRRR